MSASATTSCPPEITQLLREALAYARTGDKVRSHNLFRQVTLFDPQNEAAWLWFANTAENPADAVNGLRTALRLNPNNHTAQEALPVALFRAGVAAARAGNRAVAAGYLADATSHDPRNEAAWLWRAGVCDDPVRSLEYLSRVLEINPKNTQAQAGAAKLRAQVAPPWSCPICEYRPDTMNDTVADMCPQCGGVISLNRPEAFDHSDESLDRNAVTVAARRLKALWSTTPTAETAFALGLALLNLGHNDDGIRALQVAARTNGAEPAWRDAVARFIDFREKRGGHPTTPPPPPAKRGPVMIVDDSSTVRILVSSILNEAGYQVFAAESAEEAARLIQAGNIPKLFILDVNMPGTDGFGLCKVLRGHSQTANIPVVFLTGKTGLLSKLHGRWVGAAEYLTKPFQHDKLLATVARLVPATRK